MLWFVAVDVEEVGGMGLVFRLRLVGMGWDDGDKEVDEGIDTSS